MPVEKWSDTVVVVHLGNDPQFSEDLESLEERIGQGKVDALLDLSGVSYINSSNIARLLKIRKMMATTDSRLVLCGVNNRIWSTLLITGLDKIFKFSDDVPTGLATLQMAAS